MEQRLVLEDQQGTVLRVFSWDGEPLKVLRREDTRRLELAKSSEKSI